MYILETFWNGHPAGYERMIRDNSEYKKIAHQSLVLAEEIDAVLDAEKRKNFERYQSLQLDLNTISEQDSFVRGVRLGARFILDVLGEYRSQLPFHEELKAEQYSYSKENSLE
ncbi:MAG: hypothetical protein IJ042_05380 [Butyricicoccus sp.]|nr:hypothetical protein [Butyricicoccus sp.]